MSSLPLKNMPPTYMWMWVKTRDEKLSTNCWVTTITRTKAKTPTCPVSWGCRIHWLHICRLGKTPPNECPGYDTKQSDAEVSVMQGTWGIQSTPSLPLLPGPLWPGVVAPDRAQSMG